MKKNFTFAIMGDDRVLKVMNKDGVYEPVSVDHVLCDNMKNKESTPTDKDNKPITERNIKKLRPVPRVKTLRRALHLTQEEFASRYSIPLGTLRDWEQGRTQPDQPTSAYLKVIAFDPEWILRALHSMQK